MHNAHHFTSINATGEPPRTLRHVLHVVPDISIIESAMATACGCVVHNAIIIIVVWIKPVSSAFLVTQLSSSRINLGTELGYVRNQHLSNLL